MYIQLSSSIFYFSILGIIIVLFFISSNLVFFTEVLSEKYFVFLALVPIWIVALYPVPKILALRILVFMSPAFKSSRIV